MASYDIHEAPLAITEEEALEVGSAAVDFIIGGDSTDEPYNLIGLGVFGVIGTLRENDELLHDDERQHLPLSADQRERLTQVEGVVDAAVEADAQYYPFGHNTTHRYYIDFSDTRMKQLAMDRSGREVMPRGYARGHYAYIRSHRGHHDTVESGPVSIRKIEN